jgi:hypothetical protein
MILLLLFPGSKIEDREINIARIRGVYSLHPGDLPLNPEGKRYAIREETKEGDPALYEVSG